MSWAKGDDLYDDKPKIKKAWRLSGDAVGLHWMAVTASCRHESDGLVDPEWLAEKLSVLPSKKRADVALQSLVELGLFETLKAGATREFTDRKGFTVSVGPLGEDAFIVHDYLDYQDSSAYLEDRRRKDSERKAAGGRATGRKDSERNPSGIPTDSGSPDPTRPDPTRPPAHAGRADARAGEASAAAVADVIAVLSQCARLRIEQMGVENAIAAWPGRDYARAAHTVVTWASDPAFRTTNAAKLLGDALSKQTPEKAAADEKTERNARRLRSLHSLTGGEL